MRKLTLDLEDLTVESFDTTALRRRARGTVRAFDSVQPQDTQDSGCYTTCGGTDWVECDYTNVSCIEQSTPDASCYGDTCFGVSCGPEGSCSQGCSPSGSGGCSDRWPC
ncbi:MAG TPA: hypothetical protein VF746_06345 [Longimicrobium sp.]|jgi:hypothetical protein